MAEFTQLIQKTLSLSPATSINSSRRFGFIIRFSQDYAAYLLLVPYKMAALYHLVNQPVVMADFSV